MWDPSSLSRDRTCIPHFGSRSLNHWTPGKSLIHLFRLFDCGIYSSKYVPPSPQKHRLKTSGPKICPREQKVKQLNISWNIWFLSDPMDCSLPGSSVHGIFPGKSTGVGRQCLLHRNILELSKVLTISYTWCKSINHSVTAFFKKKNLVENLTFHYFHQVENWGSDLNEAIST